MSASKTESSGAGVEMSQKVCTVLDGGVLMHGHVTNTGKGGWRTIVGMDGEIYKDQRNKWRDGVVDACYSRIGYLMTWRARLKFGFMAQVEEIRAVSRLMDQVGIKATP